MLVYLANSVLFEQDDEEIDEDAIRELEELIEVDQQVRKERLETLNVC